MLSGTLIINKVVVIGLLGIQSSIQTGQSGVGDRTGGQPLVGVGVIGAGIDLLVGGQFSGIIVVCRVLDGGIGV